MSKVGRRAWGACGTDECLGINVLKVKVVVVDDGRRVDGPPC